jgi:hypothetical protein
VGSDAWPAFGILTAAERASGRALYSGRGSALYSGRGSALYSGGGSRLGCGGADSF